MLANRKNARQRIELVTAGMAGAPVVLVIDDDRALTEVNWLYEDGCLTLPPQSVLLLKWPGR